MIVLSRLLLFVAIALGLDARWDNDHAATITFYQTARSCLYVTHATGEQAFIGCYGRWPASVVVPLGGPNTDAAFRPSSGDVYTLVQGAAVVARAPLRGRNVYLPVMR